MGHRISHGEGGQQGLQGKAGGTTEHDQQQVLGSLDHAQQRDVPGLVLGGITFDGGLKDRGFADLQTNDQTNHQQQG